jgi:hypothetical protein
LSVVCCPCVCCPCVCCLLSLCLLSLCLVSVVCVDSELDVLALDTSVPIRSLSDEITRLTRLPTIKMNNARLAGTIPSDISVMTALRKLRAFDNFLNGSLPLSSFAAMTWMTYVQV